MLFRGDYSEKRDFMRMAVECPMSFTLPGEDTVHRATARDLSASGLLMRCNRELAEGSSIEVSVEPEEAIVPPLKATCEVVRVTTLAPGEYEVGLKISAIAPSEEGGS
jgi:hypothetical protein